MNTTIAVVLPAWMAWLLTALIVLWIANDIAGLYLKWLKRKISRIRAELDDDAA